MPALIAPQGPGPQRPPACLRALENVHLDAQVLVPALSHALQEHDPMVRQEVLRLRQLDAAAAVPVFLEALNDREPELRQQAVWGLHRHVALGAIIVPALAPLLQDESPAVRVGAIGVLAASAPMGCRSLSRRWRMGRPPSAGPPPALAGHRTVGLPGDPRPGPVGHPGRQPHRPQLCRLCPDPDRTSERSRPGRGAG